MSAGEVGDSSVVFSVGASWPSAVLVSMNICWMNKSKITELQRRTFLKVSMSQRWAYDIMFFSY